MVIVGTLVSWTAWLAVQVPVYRHASGVYRQQLKWLYSGAVIFVFAYFGVFIATLAVQAIPGWNDQSVTNALAIIGTAALPACLGVAALKYRLYDLNRVISRVVSYALVTALLAGVFAGLILLATRELPVRGSVAVAVATLVIAALFNPLRGRVQRAVDRRFNRSRYDAEAVVAAFTARLRHTVDLDTLRHDLVGVTQEAFQPAHTPCGSPPRPPATRTAPRSRGGPRNLMARRGLVSQGVGIPSRTWSGPVAVNQQVRLADRPSGLPRPSDWEFTSERCRSRVPGSSWWRSRTCRSTRPCAAG